MNIKEHEHQTNRKKKNTWTSPNQRASTRANIGKPTRNPHEPSRTQHPPTSSLPPRRNQTEIPIKKATPLFWPDFGIEKIDNDIGPKTALVPEAEKLRRPSGVKLATAVLEHGEDWGVFADCIGFALCEKGGEAISFSKPRSNQTQSNPPMITDQSRRERLDPSKPSRTQHPSSLSRNPDPKRKKKER